MTLCKASHLASNYKTINTPLNPAQICAKTMNTKYSLYGEVGVGCVCRGLRGGGIGRVVITRRT